MLPALSELRFRGGFVKTILTITMLLICFGIPFHAQSAASSGKEFTIDVPESKIEFFVGTSAGDVNGAFKSWKGDLKLATAGPRKVRRWVWKSWPTP
jgi:hypothetical protein